MIALSASSQNGLSAPDSYRDRDSVAADSLTCFTRAEIRQIAKGLTELDYSREQLAINREIIAKGQELVMQTDMELEAANMEVEHLRRWRKWWFAIGAAVPITMFVLMQ